VLEIEFDDGNEVGERPDEPDVLHRGLKIRDAVLKRDVVNERRGGLVVRRDLGTEVALDRERAQPFETVG
jgi:hypothetical protein